MQAIIAGVVGGGAGMVLGAVLAPFNSSVTNLENTDLPLREQFRRGGREIAAQSRSWGKNLLVIGAAWLLAFPFVIFTAQGVPLIWRERYVAGGCAFLQCTALAALGILVLVDGSFKKLSSVAGGGVDVAARAKLGRRGFRAKVAID